MEHSHSYGFGVTLDLPYADAVAKTRAALARQGFGIMTEIDVRQAMLERLGAEFRPYLVLGACIPPLAYRLLNFEPNVGLIIPCNVIIFEESPGRSRVMAMDPIAALELIADKRVDEVACQVKSLLEAALRSL